MIKSISDTAEIVRRGIASIKRWLRLGMIMDMMV